jgi:hypothetical protein
MRWFSSLLFPLKPIAFVLVQQGTVPRLTTAAWKEVKYARHAWPLRLCAPFFLLKIVGVLMEMASSVKDLGKGCTGLLRYRSNCGTEGVEGNRIRLGKQQPQHICRGIQHSFFSVSGYYLCLEAFPVCALVAW